MPFHSSLIPITHFCHTSTCCRSKRTVAAVSKRSRLSAVTRITKRVPRLLVSWPRRRHRQSMPRHFFSVPKSPHPPSVPMKMIESTTLSRSRQSRRAACVPRPRLKSRKVALHVEPLAMFPRATKMRMDRTRIIAQKVTTKKRPRRRRARGSRSRSRAKRPARLAIPTTRTTTTRMAPPARLD